MHGDVVGVTHRAPSLPRESPCLQLVGELRDDRPLTGRRCSAQRERERLLDVFGAACYGWLLRL